MTATELCAPPDTRPGGPDHEPTGHQERESCVAERRSPAREQRRRTDQYAHLAPLFAELARLPEGDRRSAALREQLIIEHLPVARHIAQRYAHRRELLQDLEQVATVGLIHAVDRFNPELGHEFLTFAVPTINGEVQRWFRDRMWVVRVPRRLKELHVAITGAVAALSQELGRAPSSTEIATRLDVPVADVVDGLQVRNAYRCLSLDEPAGTGAKPGRAPRFAAAMGNLDPGVALVENRESLIPLIDALSERERRIVLMRFFGDMTQSQIAREVGVSQMHVSRLLTATLARLRRAMTVDT
jgi:RNA polymerase sigma-B factor